MSTAGDRSATYLDLSRAVLYREFVLFVRYPADAVGFLVMMLVFFGTLFYGGMALAGEAITNSKEGLIVGFYLWTLTTGSYQGLTNVVSSEASWGTLERHFITPFGFGPVLLLKAVGRVVRSFLLTSAVLLVVIAVTGASLVVDVVTVLPLLALSIAPVLGIGFAMGGFAVLYKRISNWTFLLQFGFIGLISAPSFDVAGAAFLPLVQGSALLQRAMKDGVRLWEFQATELGILVVTAAVYFALGYALFFLAQRRARRLGVLGDY